MFHFSASPARRSLQVPYSQWKSPAGQRGSGGGVPRGEVQRERIVEWGVSVPDAGGRPCADTSVGLFEISL